ncbi:hypothetical protein [Bacillus cereus]|nr:hypothetical protein [Bacillus cereus]
MLENTLLAQITLDLKLAENIEILANEPTVITYMDNLLSDIDLSFSKTKL